MANTITGRVLSVGQPLQVAGKDPSRPITKRVLLLDCTRHDPYTGERSQWENTPEMEFSGDTVPQLDSVRPGDIVTVSFSVEGSKYTDRDGRERIFTRIRPYRLERRQPQTHQVQQAAQPAHQAQQYVQPQQHAPQQQYVQPMPYPPLQSGGDAPF